MTLVHHLVELLSSILRLARAVKKREQRQDLSVDLLIFLQFGFVPKHVGVQESVQRALFVVEVLPRFRIKLFLERLDRHVSFIS